MALPMPIGFGGLKLSHRFSEDAMKTIRGYAFLFSVLGLSLGYWGCGRAPAEGSESSNPGIGVSKDSTSSKKGGDGDSSDSDNSDSSEEGENNKTFTDEIGTKPKDKGTDTEDGKLLYTYIWIANSMEGTISKINTRTMKEEGRYQTRPDRLGNPSRTSVGVRGDVVVANRHGGVTKVIANVENCKDQDGDGKIKTSTGASDVLAWGEDECVAWYTPMEYQSQRVAAWTYEEIDGGEGAKSKKGIEKVWISGIKENGSDIEIMLLDGNTGKILDQVTVSGMTAPVFPWGAYGGAVDHENDLWFSNVMKGKLVRVRYKTLEVEMWDKPYDSYGITVDPDGRPWVCGAGSARFDPKTETWEAVQYPVGRTSIGGGCMVDAKRRIWHDVREGLTQATVTAIDIDSLKIVKTIKMPEHSKGISVDFDGKVWGVGLVTKAYRIDPETEKIEVFDGLTSPYTYSDMTGFALGAVQDPPPK